MNFAPVFEIISDFVFMLYLAWAAYQDHKERLVLRGTHLIGLAAVGLSCVPAFIRRAAAGYEKTAALLLCFMCEAIYRRFSLYGLADSLVFFNCCLYYWVRTDAFLTFFLFWWLKAVSGMLLLAVQSVRCRRLRWRMEEPTAYIPWILCAFALTNIGLKGYNHWY